jgi:hypothetical protein
MKGPVVDLFPTEWSGHLTEMDSDLMSPAGVQNTTDHRTPGMAFDHLHRGNGRLTIRT